LPVRALKAGGSGDTRAAQAALQAPEVWLGHKYAYPRWNSGAILQNRGRLKADRSGMTAVGATS
jgi:hypothetical protein